MVLLVGLGSGFTAQTPPPATRLANAVSKAAFQSHLVILADDLLEARAPATRGGELAARYIATQFRRLGLQPAGDNGTYFHRVPVITHTPMGGVLLPPLLSRAGSSAPRRSRPTPPWS